jgi:hypothetical protein
MIVACVRIASGGEMSREVRTFGTTTKELLALSDWLKEKRCTHVAMEATGVYWRPVWHVLEPDFHLVLANAAHIRNVPSRKTDVNDAMWTADLLAHSLIRAGFVPPVAIQERVTTLSHSALLSERRNAVARLRDELTEEDRAILVLRVDRGLEWDEIALAFLDDSSAGSEQARRREAERLRKRFQLIKQRLAARARDEGLV